MACSGGIGLHAPSTYIIPCVGDIGDIDCVLCLCHLSLYLAGDTTTIVSRRTRMPNNKKKKGGNKKAAARSNAANKEDLAGLDEILRYSFLCLFLAT